MQQDFSLPGHIREMTEKFFGTSNVSEACNILKLSKTLISFSKGHPDQYFIVSGIVKGRPTYECKIVYKKRLENSERGPLKSHCTCHSWNEKDHCSHTAGLYLSFLLQIHYVENRDGSIDRPFEEETYLENNDEKYGKIIARAQSIHEEEGSLTLQSFLNSSQAMSCPIPEYFSGEILMCIEKRQANKKDIIDILFQHKDIQGRIHKKISLFENLYLFNWSTRQLYHLPDDVKKFIQAVRPYFGTDRPYEYVDLYYRTAPQNILKLVVDGEPFENIEEEPIKFQLTLEPDRNKNIVDMQFSFFNYNKNYIPAPKFLQFLCFEGGKLETFKKKKSAYHFIGELYKSIKENNDAYRKAIYLSSVKDEWINLIRSTKMDGKYIHYNYETKKKYSLQNSTILQIFTSLYQYFGESVFRSSSYSDKNNIISYDLSLSSFFNGLSNFYTTLQPLGLKIFYDTKMISSWDSKLRFTKSSLSKQSFNLEISLTKEDLEIIKNADIENGVVLTKKGLVLLTQKQKDLIYFMKRYIKYEDKSANKKEEMKKFSIPFNRSRIFELFEIKKLGIEGTLTEEEEKICERLINLQQLPSYPIDYPEIERILRPYQKIGLNWLRFLHENQLGACLADDMGLGKTIQAIALIRSIIDSVEKILIVCPVSILLNWEKEFKKFSSLDVYIYHGGERCFPEDRKIVITSYGIMKKEITETFADKKFDILVFDEVQHLKNIRSIGAFAARKLSADFRLCLTGTPVENNISEFYNILDLAMPGLWGDLGSSKKIEVGQSYEFAKKTARPFILRRTKGQVLKELPPKQEHNVFLNFSEEERDYYEQSFLDIKKNIILSPKNKKYGEILKGLLNLRRCCLWHKTERGLLLSTKIDFLMVQLEQILDENYQSLIFSQFTTYLDIIGDCLKKKNQNFARIDGSHNIKHRQKEIDAFQKGEKRIFLISLKAGGIGLNLTAASYVFLMDPWWNPAAEQQAVDRAHRIGQKNTLIVYRPIIKDSIEEKVLELKETKKALFDQLLETNSGELFQGNLSMKDFEYLFESQDIFKEEDLLSTQMQI